MALIPLYEAKTYLRVDSSDEDALIGILLSSARQSMPLIGMPRTEYSPQGNWKPCAVPAVWRFCMHWGISMSTGTKPTITS